MTKNIQKQHSRCSNFGAFVYTKSVIRDLSEKCESSIWSMAPFLDIGPIHYKRHCNTPFKEQHALERWAFFFREIKTRSRFCKSAVLFSNFLRFSPQNSGNNPKRRTPKETGLARVKEGQIQDKTFVGPKSRMAYGCWYEEDQRGNAGLPVGAEGIKTCTFCAINWVLGCAGPLISYVWIRSVLKCTNDQYLLPGSVRNITYITYNL